MPIFSHSTNDAPYMSSTHCDVNSYICCLIHASVKILLRQRRFKASALIPKYGDGNAVITAFYYPFCHQTTKTSFNMKLKVSAY